MDEKKQTIAIIGSTGLVGQEIFSLLKKRNFPIKHLKLFASENSVGKKIFGQKIEPLKSLKSIDLAFFAADAKISEEWILKTNCTCIDLSSYARKNYPLIVPEINAHLMQGNIFASPNCAATLLSMALFPLHQLFTLKRVIVSTYQAASGGGMKLLSQLDEEIQAYAKNPSGKYEYAMNLFPHNSPLLENGYVEEEIKIMEETKKILGAPSLQISATAVRVPVKRAHSLSVNVEFSKPFSMPEIYEALRKMEGVKIFEDRDQNRFATPKDVEGKNEVFCGRFRFDPSRRNTLEFWIVGDQLLKGAALNAVQIAEKVILPVFQR